MFDSKYSKVLTIVLIVIIVLVIGLLIYLAIDAFKGYTIEKESEEVLGQFESTFVNTVQDDNIQTNELILDSSNTILDSNSIITEPIIDEDYGQGGGSGNSGSSGGSSGDNKVTYKGYEVIGTIEIPATDIKYPILNQISIRSLEASIGYIYGPGLNQVGNSVLIGHNYRNGTFFSNNKRLQDGDKIYITDSTGNRVTYIVNRKYETTTSDFSYATRDTGGKRGISLSTCTDDTKKRLIIWADEE